LAGFVWIVDFFRRLVSNFDFTDARVPMGFGFGALLKLA
jgi:hypothetical protein